MNAPPGATTQEWAPNTVVIPAVDFESGRLPGICAVTGAPATANLERRYTSTPGWVGCLFFISWFALAIAYLFTHQQVTGRLPVTSAIAAKVERLHQRGSLLFGAGLLLWLVTVLIGLLLGGTSGSIIFATGFSLGAVCLVASFVMGGMESAALGVKGRVSNDGFGTRWVQLRGVHPAFVQAVVNSRR